MLSLLDGFLRDRTVTLIGLPVLLMVLVAMFAQDVRRARRGEPIQWFGSKTYPGDPWYGWMAASYFRPYAAIFGVIILLVLLLLWAWLFGPQS